jgi:DNA-binding HxlR family transcriptional regulator
MARAGARALTLLSVALNVEVITALADGPRALIDLRRATGSPPQTTMRRHLQALTDLGVLERRREAAFPGAVEYELGRAGRELTSVMGGLGHWLASSPQGPVQPGSTAARSAIKALVDGWSSTIVRTLAEHPRSLTELNCLIDTLNYPSLERRLAAMRIAGLITHSSGEGRGRPYRATDWLRQAVGPLTMAANWEGRHDSEAAPAGRIEVESALLLTVPTLTLPPGASGTVHLVVEVRGAEGHGDLAGVAVDVKDGKVLSCVSRLPTTGDASIAGSAGAWFRALQDGFPDGLEVGGEAELGHSLIDSFPRAFFGARAGHYGAASAP